jgi:hypothetical protein
MFVTLLFESPATQLLGHQIDFLFCVCSTSTHESGALPGSPACRARPGEAGMPSWR